MISRRTCQSLAATNLGTAAVHHKQIFVFVDGSILFAAQYLNILFGSLETPHVNYLYDCQSLPYAPKTNSIAHAVDDTVRFLGINRNSLCRLLSDVAKYMMAAGAILKSLYPKLFHVTRVAHLLHNCTMKSNITLKMLINSSQNSNQMQLK